MYVDVTADDSYTPRVVSVRAGTHYGDLQEVSTALHDVDIASDNPQIKLIELDQPKGWQHFRLGNSVGEANAEEEFDPRDPDSYVPRCCCC
jgi:anaphase-promoting complex subunit 10